MATSANGSNFLFSQELGTEISMSTQQDSFAQRSFANITRSENFPKRNAGILINYIEGTQIQEYIRAVGTIVGPRNVQHAARVSSNRICIFLTNKELVEDLVNSHNSLKIKDQNAEIRRLVAPEQKVVISNIWPEVPNYLVENFINQCGIKLLTPITHIKYNDIEDEYNHVCTFRRQFQISAEDVRLLPASTAIEHEKRRNYIFFSTDVTCFSCKEKGHIAKRCPKKQQNTAEIQISAAEIRSLSQDAPTISQPAEETIPQPRPTYIESPILLPENPRPSQQNIEEAITTPVNTQNTSADSAESVIPEEAKNLTPAERKRKGMTPNPSVSSLEETETEKSTLNSEDETQENLTPEKKINTENKTSQSKEEKKKNNPKVKNLKKPKRSESPECTISIGDLLEPAKTAIDSYPIKYILNFNELVQFVEEAQNSGDYIESLEKYTNEIPRFILGLQEVRKHLCGQGKNRITRVINKLNDELNTKLDKEQTDNSQTTN